ncbi:MAG: hypothetical protein AAFO69_04980 [Bacteroidota bacterium]
MTKYIIFLLLIGGHFSAGACGCNPHKNLQKSRKYALKYTDMIFIGEVTPIPKNAPTSPADWGKAPIFEVIVTEQFKGVNVGDTLSGIIRSSCSITPTAGLWLIYAEVDEQGFISIASCGLSRAFYQPERIFYEQYTMRPPTIAELENPQPNDDLDWAIALANIKLQAAKDLKEEVLWLRTKK